MRATFAEARLPQTSLTRIASKGHAITLRPNEFIASRVTGFLNLGVEASFGYKMQGKASYELGAADLVTTLTMQARAYLKAGYQLAGAFQVVVTSAMDKPEWVRVTVEKDRHSTFDFGVGVAVNVAVATPGTDKGGLPLIEAILGATSGQVLRKALTYASLDASELKKRADGFTKAIVEEWTGKAFDRIPKAVLNDVLGGLQRIESTLEEINQLDDRAIDLYENFLDVLGVNSAVNAVDAVLEATDPDDQRQKLLAAVTDVRVRALIEAMAGEHIGRVFTDIDSIHQRIAGEWAVLKQLLTGDAKAEIRNFIEAKVTVLGVPALAAELKKYSSKTALKRRASHAAKELVERLTGQPLDSIFNDPRSREIIGGVNDFAKRFTDVVEEVGDAIHEALNAKGRFEISYAYQKVQAGEKLVDLEIHVGTAQAPVAAGVALYGAAVAGDFQEIFADRYRDVVDIAEAAFTDTLQTTSTLNVHVFGWDYKEVKSLLSKLDASVQRSGTGDVTVYKLRAEGKVVTASRRRATELGYLVQVAGSAQGAFFDDALSARVVADAMKELESLTSQFRFEITDPLTTLDELEMYFELGVKMHILSRGQLTRLIHTIGKLRALGASDTSFGKVGVRYSVSFEGKALARALTTDYSTLIDTPGDGGNAEAVRRLFRDRLLTSYYVHREGQPAASTVALLYEAGIFEALEEARQKGAHLVGDNWAYPRKELTVTRGDTTLAVRPNQQDVANAWVLYWVNVEFAKLIERFRIGITGENKITYGEFRRLLENVVEKLRDVGTGNGIVGLQSMPYLVLDEMVRLTNGGAGADTRKALLEVILYSDDGKKELNYIPISA